MGSKRSKISRASKRSKISRVDLISNLPDSLLLMILSLLPFESAVRTSVLSKRWRPLCMSLSNLRFNDKYGNKKSGPHFIHSVDRFLMHRPLDLNIEQLSLECSGDYDSTHVDQWIRKALEHQVKDLTLAFHFRGGSYELLQDMYTYANFEVLRLRRGILVDIPYDYCTFSRLKVLEFWYVTFSDYELMKQILLDCPVLEDLLIKKCKWLSGCDLYVCGSALKNLTLKCNEQHVDTKNLQIVIDTPALENLKIGDSTCADIFIEHTLLSLRTAHISVHDDASVFELLDTVHHVQFLTLTDKTLGALDGVSDLHLPTFHNLIQLELRVDNWPCWNLLKDILANSPNLQSLLLPYGVDLTHTCRSYDYCLWSSPRLVPECLSSNLKTIEIGIFNGTEDEFSLVDYLLGYGRALRKISINCSNNCSESQKLRIRRKLNFDDRASKTCKIDFN